ncbi:hypothetical protein O4H52_00975 [Sphingomonadaceae bacterium G21617-S1]|nr:hypothetical protein [Sphingomonadaceae bacterium G21617-S1]
MAGGFHIPSFMVESQKSGRELVAWVRDIWGGVMAESIGQVKLGGWLMADPTKRPRQAEAIGADLSALLSGKALPSAEQIRQINELTAGAISRADWTTPYTSGADLAAPVGDGAAVLAPPAAPSPERPLAGHITVIEEGCETPRTVREASRVRGTLGQTEGGPLFSCDRVSPNRFLLASSMGWSLGLDRAGATAMLEALAGQLGVALPERRA